MPPTRRNLFQGHLSRRPTPSAASTSTSVSNSSINNNNNTASTAVSNDVFSSDGSQSVALPNNNNNNNSSSTTSSRETSVLVSTTTCTTDNNANGGEIIARDKNGNFQLDIPVLPPPPPDEDVDDETMEGIEEGRPSGGSGSSGANASTGIESDIGARDKEKFEANLLEMIQRSRGRHLSSEPEILGLIQQSLRAKVASLDEDNWMFEIEDDTPA